MLDGPRAHELELAVARGGKARGQLAVRLEKLLELRFADAADDRLRDGLCGARVHRQVSEADDVAGKGELDDFVVAVVPPHVVAQGAALDAIELVALISRVETVSRRARAVARHGARSWRNPSDDGRGCGRSGRTRLTWHLLSSVGADDMGIGPATIKSKSELVQPSKRIGYLYNVEPSGLFPKEQAHSSSGCRTLRRCVRRFA